MSIVEERRMWGGGCGPTLESGPLSIEEGTYLYFVTTWEWWVCVYLCCGLSLSE